MYAFKAAAVPAALCFLPVTGMAKTVAFDLSTSGSSVDVQKTLPFSEKKLRPRHCYT